MKHYDSVLKTIKSYHIIVVVTCTFIVVITGISISLQCVA